MALDDHKGVQSTVQLVTGTFSPMEAADLLLSLLAYKIKFQTVQMLNKEERYSPDNISSEQHIEELKNARLWKKA